MSTEFRSSAPDEVCRWVDEHSEYLVRYACRYLGSQDLAEDIVQDTFLAAVEGFDRFEGRSTPRTWLVSILRHKVFSLLRKRSRAETTQGEQTHGADGRANQLFDDRGHWIAESGPADWRLSPDTVVQNQEFLSAFGQCLEKLPQRFREVFLLRELDEFSRDEVATQLGLKSNHIGVILYRARLELQNCLSGNWLNGGRKR